MLTIKNLTKIYNHKKVLDTINLEVVPGSIIVLLGQSGVGKSTLLRILNSLETCDVGAIFLDHKELKLKKGVHNPAFGMLFQHFNLFDHLTVQENIMLALQKVQHKSAQQAQQIAQELLQHYGLADKADAYPAQLSGGQKQRLALARTIALKPLVICLDEPTSALDPLLTNYVAQSIQELASQGFMVIIATHDISLLERLNATIYLMEAGKIVESATTQDFYANKKKFPLLARFISGQ